ncbi:MULTISPECIES: hypothetical protein [unclassified Marinobacterium]|uniref:hypothetical protein n=1 Tax=unclassified Marinobacterium TaxID=2644139 RepID=UPI001568982D|nr:MULTISPECIES: hypothetical protein [unclassified Marinobacterium]NRP10117.1 hypothetical protein [Marinobacterium sp. xm-g-48]NRP83216.1 hypothetical protein [Marinobacterium sp. xm-d-509]
MFKKFTLVTLVVLFVIVFFVTLNAGIINKVVQSFYSKAGAPVKSTLFVSYRSFKKTLKTAIEGQLEEEIGKSQKIALVEETEEINVRIISFSEDGSYELYDEPKEKNVLPIKAGITSEKSSVVSTEKRKYEKPIKLQENKVKELLTPLYVKTNVENPKVRILNIKPRFSNGIKLKNGSYEIEVSKEGYRTQIEWVTIDNFSGPDNKKDLDRITASFDLQKNGVEGCSDKLEYNIQPFTDADDGPGLITFRLIYDNASVPELYRSSYKLIDDSNNSRILKSTLSQNYSEAIFSYEPLTAQGARDNRDKNLICETGPDTCYVSNALAYLTFEKTAGGVQMIDQHVFPNLAIARIDKDLMCELNYNQI